MINILFSMNVEGVRIDFVQHSKTFVIALSKKNSDWLWYLSVRETGSKYNTYRYRKYGYIQGFYIDMYCEPNEDDPESMSFWKTNFKKINLKSINNLI